MQMDAWSTLFHYLVDCDCHPRYSGQRAAMQEPVKESVVRGASCSAVAGRISPYTEIHNILKGTRASVLDSRQPSVFKLH